MIHPDIPAAARMLTRLTVTGDALDDALYAWYLSSTPSEPAELPGPADINLGGALAAAHADATRFVGGWRVASATPMGGVVAAKGEWKRYLPRVGYLVPACPGLAGRPGDAILACAAWTWSDHDHGFWYARGGPWPPPGADRLTRTYLNVNPADAPRVVAVLTELMGRHRDTSYQLKTPLDGRRSSRADAVVLYLGAPDAEALDADVRAAVRRLAGVLRPARPRFTASLGPGAGQADGDIDGASFGQSRCEILARVWRGLDRDVRRDLPAVTAAVVSGFTAAGVDVEAPYRLAQPVPVRPGGGS